MADWLTDAGQIVSHARWWAGPVFDKELRVTSRRRRYYLLRFAYVSLLVLVTLYFWYVLVHVRGGASSGFQASRLSAAGLVVIVTVVWFQFVAAQVLAAVLLCDAISSEIRQRTLEGLLVTPLGAVHIVVGKLLSRLLLLVLLLALSLPVLAVVRVFGGVPWDYVAASLGITLCGAVFAGSMSLLYSITLRHAYQPVLVVGLWYLVVWGLCIFPVLGLFSMRSSVGMAPVYVLSLIDPVLALFARTQMLLGGMGGRGGTAPLLLHCLTMLAAAAVMLALAVRRVRRVALRSEYRLQAGKTLLVRLDKGQEDSDPRKRGTPNKTRRVQGPPIVWRELRGPLFRTPRQVLSRAVVWVLVVALLFAPVIISRGMLAAGLLLPIWVLHLLLVIRLAVTAGGAVTREKEARTWAVLLTTPLDDAEIVKGKAWAALRRNAPLLVPLLLLYLVLALQGPGQGFPLVILLTYAGLAGTVVFLLGLGLYLSTRLKTTTGAVLATLGVYGGPKLFFCGASGPFVFLVTRGPGGPPGRSAGAVLYIVPLVIAAVYAAVGLVCLRLAARRLRRNIF